MSKKGQASLEQLMVTGLALTFVALIFYIAINYANDSVRATQGKDTVDKIAYAADYVYSLGPGSREIVRVNVPEGLEAFDVSGNRVYVRASLSSGSSDFFANTRASLFGSLPTNPGPQDIILSVTPNGSVRIGVDQLTCTPSSITKTFVQGDTGSDSVAVKNVVDFQIDGVAATLSGNMGDVTTLVQPSATLAPGGSTSVGLNFNIPLSTTPGTYSGYVNVNGTNSSICFTQVTLFIARVGGPDTSGPIVSSLTHAPPTPSTSSVITINATGDDSTTGNSTILMCQAMLDGSGIWNDMVAVGGSYGESSTQAVSYLLGPLTNGTHNVSVRCIDSVFNVGNTSFTSFSVVSGGDVTGPIVTALSYGPASPTVSSNITVNATGSDATTGNRNVSMCQIQLDGGAFNNMTAFGTAYNTSVTQNANHSLGTLSKGSHTIGVRCIDSVGNIGSINTTTITVSRKSILLVTQSAAPNTAEQAWLTWIQTHSSALSLDWGVDQVGRASVTGGTTNLSNYRIVVLPTAPNSDVTLYSILNGYKMGGNHVVLVGSAINNGISKLNVGSGSGSTSNNQLNIKIQASHYITTGYSVGSTYTISTANQQVTYHSASTITNAASVISGDTRGTILAGSNVTTFGAQSPNLFNVNGNTFATRVLDYALNNSASN